MPHLLPRLVRWLPAGARLTRFQLPQGFLPEGLLPALLLPAALVLPLGPLRTPPALARTAAAAPAATMPAVGSPLDSAAIPWDPAALKALAAACPELRRAGGLPLRQRQLQLRQQLSPQPPLAEVLAVADALLACAAPQAALEVLERTPPAEGPEQRAWLLLQWQAAQAGLHHAEAARSLRLLAEGDLTRLETLPLPVRLPGDGPAAGPPPSRPALDLLADHLESLEQPAEAAEVLLASRQPGPLTAARWGRAVQLARQLPLQQRDAILERALEQAAADQAWGLVAALLDQQLASGVSDVASRQALERRLRLGARIDDAYGEWLQRRRQPEAASDARLQELERQLRSPRAAGGHADPASQAPAAPFLTPSALPLP